MKALETTLRFLFCNHVLVLFNEASFEAIRKLVGAKFLNSVGTGLEQFFFLSTWFLRRKNPRPAPSIGTASWLYFQHVKQ